MKKEHREQMIIRSHQAKQVVQDLMNLVDPVHIETCDYGAIHHVKFCYEHYFHMVSTLKFVDRYPDCSEAQYTNFNKHFMSIVSRVKLIKRQSGRVRISSELDKYFDDVKG